VGVITFGALAFALVALIDSTTVMETVANGAVIMLAFVSDVFVMSDAMPAWLRTVGDVFPLKHFASRPGRGLRPVHDGCRAQLAPQGRDGPVGGGCVGGGGTPFLMGAAPPRDPRPRRGCSRARDGTAPPGRADRPARHGHAAVGTDPPRDPDAVA